MKRYIYSVLPMMILLLIISLLIIIEYIFMNQIINLFDIEEIESFNTFNNGFILVSGGISFYILTKYVMEINERIFRILTFLLNFLGIITIMTVFIRAGIIK
jgi:hypothetical protein